MRAYEGLIVSQKRKSKNNVFWGHLWFAMTINAPPLQCVLLPDSIPGGFQRHRILHHGGVHIPAGSAAASNGARRQPLFVLVAHRLFAADSGCMHGAAANCCAYELVDDSLDFFCDRRDDRYSTVELSRARKVRCASNPIENALYACARVQRYTILQRCAGSAAPLYYPGWHPAAYGHVPVRRWHGDARRYMQQHIASAAIPADVQPAALKPVCVSA